MSEVIKFPTKPYFDDFEEENNFLRVLFRPGYSVQTRELNQLQTILQDQIGVLADYSIPDGSKVIGGESSLVKKLPFIKLASGTVFSHAVADYQEAQFVAANGVEGTIKFAIPSVGADPSTLYVKYDVTGTEPVPANNSNITITFADTSTEVLTLATSAATGNGAAVVMNDGIFYVDKAFVRTNDQIVILNKYDSVIVDEEISVGFYISTEIVRPEEDISLLDNNTGAPNESAPGAHRYRSRVVLTNRASLTSQQRRTYKELMKIVFGEVAAKPRTDSDVTVLEQILARRTFDESGDYIVDDFVLDVREHLKVGDNRGVYTAAKGGDANKLVLQFDKGVAYVKGFEVNTAGNTYVTINKARTTDTSENTIVQNQYKNTFLVHTMIGMPLISAAIDLYAGATKIGSAFIRTVEYFETQVIASVPTEVYRVDVVGNKFNAGYSWANVNEIKHAAGVPGSPFSAKVSSYQTNANTSNLVYNLPNEIASTINPRLSFFSRQISAVSTAGILTLTPALAEETFDDEISSYTIQHPDYNGGKAARPLSVSISGNTATVNITNIIGTASISDIKVTVKTFCSAPTIRTKTLVQNAVNSGLVASKDVKLTKADVNKIVSIVTSTGVNVTGSYYLEVNAQDSYYDFSRIILRPGKAVPAGTLTVTFNYFNHGASGDFFAPDSYNSIPYNTIPTYKLSTGDQVFMGSAIDYRQRLTSANVLETVGRHAFVTNDQLVTDVTYYQGRMDRVVVTNLGRFLALDGKPADDPKLRNELANSITLYDLYIPPYTFSENDIVISKAKHRRFTMKDIAKLDSRIDNLEEVTLLNSLERDIQSQDFKDRFKSGYVADNFASQKGADVADPSHKCAYDLSSAQVRPRNITTGIDLNQTGQSGMRLHDDGILTLNYSEVPMIKQPLASAMQRIQPYILYSWVGNMSLSPQTDIWFDTKSYINTNLDGKFFASMPISNDYMNEDSLLGGTWNFTQGVWRNNISGAAATQSQQLNMQQAIIAAQNATQVFNSSSSTTTTSASWWSSRRSLDTVTTQTTTTANRILSGISSTEQYSAIPFIRSRWVSFYADSLKPGTRVYPFFANTDVSANCGPDYSSLGNAIIVNGNGTCTGVFLIPANTFRTGDRTFLLKDTPEEELEYDTTTAKSVYTAHGTNVVVTTTLNVETVLAVDVTSSHTRRWFDPLAQSFFVDSATNSGGAFVSSIDVYFGAGVSPATNKYSVTCQIREMVNGYPSETVLREVTIPPNLITGSSNGTLATRATFKSPVYLQDGTEYCFVLLSNSDTITVWVSTLGQRTYVAGDTTAPSGEIISKQAYLGSLFKSQNNSTWTADQTSDMKFQINKCDFVSAGAVTYNNAIPAQDIGGRSDEYRSLLRSNPLNFVQGDNTVVIESWGNSYNVGDVITLTKADAATEGPYHGIPYGQLFGVPLTVVAADSHTFSVNVASNATSTGDAGGYNVYITWFIGYSYAELMTDCFVAPKTGIAYSLRGKLRSNYAAGLAAKTYALNDEDLIDLGTMHVMKASGDTGMELRLDVTSSARNLSPSISEERMQINVMKNVVSDVPYLSSGGVQQDNSSPAKYVQKTVTLANAATELRVILDANLPAGTSLNAYYKVGQSSVDEQAEWIKLPVDGTLVYSNNKDEFREQRFIKTFATEFSVFKVMIEMLSTNPTVVPRLKDYRALALNG